MQLARLVTGADLNRHPAARLGAVLDAVAGVHALADAPAARVEALAVFTGQGEQWRLSQAFDRWNTSTTLRLLLIADGNPAERTYEPLSPAYLRDLGLRRTEGVVVQSEPAPNTGLQAAWTARCIQQRDVRSLALAVTPYHLPRAYLTLLAACTAASLRLPVLPLPTPVPAGTRMPETAATEAELLPGEIERILVYADRGWVADPAAFAEYLSWLHAAHGWIWDDRSVGPSR
ncbi:MAG: hypothetical protein HOV79_16820 [Hamadaea sp.]|nr:hypothetical protein [Hamadaea sp.]